MAFFQQDIRERSQTQELNVNYWIRKVFPDLLDRANVAMACTLKTSVWNSKYGIPQLSMLSIASRIWAFSWVLGFFIFYTSLNSIAFLTVHYQA